MEQYCVAKVALECYEKVLVGYVCYSDSLNHLVDFIFGLVAAEVDTFDAICSTVKSKQSFLDRMQHCISRLQVKRQSRRNRRKFDIMTSTIFEPITLIGFGLQ